MSEKKIVDQRAEALEYMKKYKINRLFDILGSRLAKEKPGDPNGYLLSELKKIRELKETDRPVTLFSEDDIEVMFSIFDLTGKGYIDQAQYIKALNAVGIQSPNLPVPKEEKIDRNKFVSHIFAEVLNDGF